MKNLQAQEAQSSIPVVLYHELMNVHFDFAFLAPNMFQPSIPPRFSPFEPRNFLFQRNDLGTCIFEFLSKSDDTQTCVFELVNLIVDTFVSTIELSLEAGNFSDQRRDIGIMSCTVQP